MENTKAFVNHKHNGVRLQFPNGNAISAIWGRGSYTENHDCDSGDVIKDYTTLNEGSDTVEIMIFTEDDRLARRIYRRCQTNPENGVIGWVDMNTWLWVIHQLAK